MQRPQSTPLWQGLCIHLSGTTIWGDGSIWWVGAWGLVFGGLLVRLVFEMASSRAAVGSVIAAGICYLWAAAVELNAVGGLSEDIAGTSKLFAVMLGHHTLLFALVSYAREVVLEAMGLLDSPAVRRAKAEAEKQARQSKQQLKQQARESETSSAKTEKPKRARKSTRKSAPTVAEATDRDSDAEPATAPRLRAVSPDPEEDTSKRTSDSRRSSKPKLKTVGSDEMHDEMYDEEFTEERKLSKAERRRLRKEQKRHQRKAA